MTRRAVLAVSVLLWAAPGAPPLPAQAGPSPELAPLVSPRLDAVEEQVRDQLEDHRQALDELAASEAPDRGALADAFGRMGQLYLLYGFEEAATPAIENARRLAPEDFRWRYYLGVLHQEKGELEAAIEAFERTLDLQPEDLPTLLRLGRAALDLGRPDEAARWYERARAGEGDTPVPAALYGLGRAALEAGDLERAVELFEEVLRQRPAASAVHYQLGLAYRQLGDLEAAREHLARRGDRAPVHADPLIDGLELLNAGAGTHMDRGNTAMAAGDLEAAVGAYRRATEVAPGHLPARKALASALARKGDLDAALEIYADLLRDDPDDPVAHFNVGNIHAAREELATATEHLRQAVELAPDFASAHLNLALLLDRQGRTREAIEQARRAVAADPEEREPKLLLAELLLGTGSLEAIEEAVEIVPERPAAHLALATALGRAGRLEEAARSFSRAVELEPGNEEAHFGRATALLLAGRETEARQALETSVERFPESVPLRHALARLLATAGEEAVRDGGRALELAQAVFRSYASVEHGATVAMAYAELGRFEEAVAWQRRILQRAESVGRSEALPELREHLESYRAGRPVRAPWRP